MAEGASVGSQCVLADVARRPRCEIWHMMAAPAAWMRPENCCRCGMISSVETFTCPPPQLESADTMEEPPIMVSAIPPRAFSSW